MPLEIAVVGRLDVSAVLSQSEELDGWSDRRYELVVEDAVNGVEMGGRVVMFGSSDETSCGTTLLDEWLDEHAVIASAGHRRQVVGSPVHRLPRRGASPRYTGQPPEGAAKVRYRRPRSFACKS